MRSFPTWKTITLGKFKSCDAYLRSAKAKGHEIGMCAKEILPKIEWAREDDELELVLGTGAELGMTENYTIAELIESVAAFGLSVCPPEVGPALRDQHDGQPVGEWMLVLMDPVLDSGSRLKVFVVVRRSDGVWLSTDCAYPEYRFALGTRWVVCRPAASPRSSDSLPSQSLGSQSYVPPVPGSDRWNDAAEAYFRSKWMQSSDGIRYLDEWKYGRKDELCVHGMRKHVCNVKDKDYKCMACH